MSVPAAAPPLGGVQPDLFHVDDLLRRLASEFSRISAEKQHLESLLLSGLNGKAPDLEKPLAAHRLHGLQRQVPGRSPLSVPPSGFREWSMDSGPWESAVLLSASPTAPSPALGVPASASPASPSAPVVPYSRQAMSGAGPVAFAKAYTVTAPPTEGDFKPTRSKVPPNRLTQLRQEFKILCQEGAAEVNADEVLNMRARLDRRAVVLGEGWDRRVAKLQDCLQTFNQAFGVFDFNGLPPRSITEETYVQLVYDGMDRVRIVDHITDVQVVEVLRDVRRVLIGVATQRAVANATGTLMVEGEEPKETGPLVRFLNRFLDPFMAFVVLCNAISIGIRCDYYEDWSGWIYIEGTYAAVFLLEFVLKLMLEGCDTFNKVLWRLFDGVVTLSAISDISIALAGKDRSNTRLVTVMSIIRFGRVMRLSKVFEIMMFKDMTLLITGLVVGLRTLLWTSVCLVYITFMLGVTLNQSIGTDDEDHRLCVDPRSASCPSSLSELEGDRLRLFGSVPRAMFTVFRCFTNDCATTTGIPLSPLLWDSFGASAIVPYVATMVAVTFGIFNLIAALFVQNTLECAREDERRRQEAQEAWKNELAAKMQQIMTAFCTGQPHPDQAHHHRKWNLFSWLARFVHLVDAEKGQQGVEEVSAEITQKMFEAALERKDVQGILDRLEIQKSNRKGLFEVLDADGSGSLEVSELVKGLLKLRGGEKHDMVALLLGFQSLRKCCKSVEELTLQQHHVVESVLSSVDELSRTLAGLAENARAGNGLVRPCLPQQAFSGYSAPG